MLFAGCPLGGGAAGALPGRPAAREGARGGRGQEGDDIAPERAFGGGRGGAGALGRGDEAIGGVFGGGSVAAVLGLAQDLAHLDTGAWEDAGEDARLERLALDAGQAGQQRGRRDQVAAVPGAVAPALLDDVQLIANLERQIGGRRGLEGEDAYGERDARQRAPGRHGTRRDGLSAGGPARGHHEQWAGKKGGRGRGGRGWHSASTWAGLRCQCP